MELAFVTFSRIPSQKANSIQSMRMCEAFAPLVDSVRLYCLEGEACANVFEHYGVKRMFEIRALRVPRVRFLERLYFAYLVIRDLRRDGQAATVYSRDLLVAGVACHFVRRDSSVTLEVHAPPKNMFWKLWLRRLFLGRRFRCLVAISKALADEYLRQFPELAGRKILVAHDGALEVPEYSADRIQVVHEAEIATKTVGYVGSLRMGKGMETIYYLASEMPDVEFHVVGGDSPTVAAWKSRAKCRNLTFHGFVPPVEAASYVRRFDVVLAPYQSVVLVGDNDVDIAPWMSPLKIFEYMSQGKAIVASNLPVLREVLRDDDNALLVDAEDLVGWKAKVELLLRDGELRHRLGRKAQADFVMSYTWKARAARIRAMLGC